MNSDTAWRLTRDADDIATLTIDRPGSSANTLSQPVLLELEQQLALLRSAPPRGLIVCSGKASGFIAGADIREFTAFRNAAERLRAHPHRPAHLRPARGPALPDGGGDRTASRSAAASSSRWPAATASRSATPGCRSACPRCSSGSTRASAARCAPCACSACARPWS